MHPFRTQAALLSTALTLIFATASRADSPVFHHHDGGDSDESDRYKDEGEKPVKAQSGRTTFQSRALIGKSGVTDLEVTTGVLDSASTPPGYLSEVHVKAYRLDGKEQFEQEFEHLRRGGGYAKFSFPLPTPPKRHRGDNDGDDDGKWNTQLQRGQRLRLEVQGRGLSGDDDDAEAKLQNIVKYRPYLMVTSLDNPAVARPNMGVEIVATVAEAMKDTGAHADCVLSVDGTAVDSAPRIWVDANGTVSCHFLHAFAVAGQHSLRVSVENVVPGDYDPDSDKLLLGSIKIESAAALAYSAAVLDLRNESRTIQDTYATSTSTVPDQHLDTLAVQRTQSRSVRGTIPVALNLPLHNVSYADQSDGAPLSSASFPNLAADVTRASDNPLYDSLAVASRMNTNTGMLFSLKRYANSSTGAGFTEVKWTFFGGDVTYHSSGYCASVAGIFNCAGGDWTGNRPDLHVPNGGVVVNIGSTFAADLTIDDGTLYQAHPAMPLSSRITPGFSWPLRCTPLAPPLFQMCQQGSSSSTIKTGSVVYTPPSM